MARPVLTMLGSWWPAALVLSSPAAAFQATAPAAPPAAATPMAVKLVDSTCAASARTPTFGTEADGDLAVPDGQFDGKPFVVFDLPADAKEAISYVVRGEGAFPPAVAIGRCVDGVYSRLGVSNLPITARGFWKYPLRGGLSAGDGAVYRLRVTSAGANTGRFKLLAQKPKLPPPPPIVDLALDGSVEGVVTTSATKTVFDKWPYVFYRLKSDQPTRVLLTMSRKAGKPSVAVGSYVSDPWKDYFINSPEYFGSVGPSANVPISLLPNTEVIVRVVAQADQEARFELSAEPASPPKPPPRPERVVIGQTVDHELRAQDATLIERLALLTDVEPTWKRYRLYALTGVARDEVSISVQTSAFDPVLQIVEPTVLTERLTPVISSGEEEPTGEEGVERTRTIEAKFEADGQILIRVTSQSNKEYGAFKLTVNRAGVKTDAAKP